VIFLRLRNDILTTVCSVYTKEKFAVKKITKNRSQNMALVGVWKLINCEFIDI
jgi:hypothetical protein